MDHQSIENNLQNWFQETILNPENCATLNNSTQYKSLVILSCALVRSEDFRTDKKNTFQEQNKRKRRS